MGKLNHCKSILLFLSVSVLLTLSACASPNASLEAQPSQDVSLSDVDQFTLVDESSPFVGIDLAATGQNANMNMLSEIESADLQFLREEEKVAQDLYLALYDLWGLPIFNNIASSETKHTEAIKQLLDAYGIEDPALSTPPGVFHDSTLQNLYDALLARGSQSLEEALMVGGLVEEVDIKDLQERINHTEEISIRNVYINLMAGSENHLRSFVARYESRSGLSYSPQYLDEFEVIQILTAATVRGQGRRSN